MACGALKLDSIDNENIYEITEIINHPAYDGTTSVNDIAVIKVDETGICSKGTIYPACVPNVEVSRCNFLLNHFS